MHETARIWKLEFANQLLFDISMSCVVVFYAAGNQNNLTFGVDNFSLSILVASYIELPTTSFWGGKCGHCLFNTKRSLYIVARTHFWSTNAIYGCSDVSYLYSQLPNLIVTVFRHLYIMLVLFASCSTDIWSEPKGRRKLHFIKYARTYNLFL